MMRSLAVVLLLALPAQAEDVVESWPRMDWRFDAPVEKVVAHIQHRSGQQIGLEQELRGRRVALEVANQTWLQALQRVSAELGAGVQRRPDGTWLVSTRFVEAPYRLVPAVVASKKVYTLVSPREDPNLGRRALMWLRKHQESDGRWTRAGRPDPAGGGDLAPTALGLLAFVWTGNTHRFGIQKRVVSRALLWLKKQQRPSGRFEDGPPRIIPHALATMALCELVFITRDPFLKRNAERAYQALSRMEAPKGGYSFHAGAGVANTLVTSFAVLALKSAKLAALKVRKTSFERCARVLQRATDKAGLTGYRLAGQGVSLGRRGVRAPPVALFSAGAVVARAFCGDPLPALRKAEDHLIPPHPDQAEPLYWYLGSYAYFHLGGAKLELWNSALWGACQKLQGPKGSFEPAGILGDQLGRAGTTALVAMTVEIYYRYQRVKENDGEDDEGR